MPPSPTDYGFHIGPCARPRLCRGDARSAVVVGASMAGIKVAVIADRKIAGANILDSCRISGIIKNYMLRLFAGEGGRVPDYQRAMLLQAGLTAEFINRMEAMTNG